MRNASVAKAANDWVGFTFLVPVMVASFADAYWDRYSTILASCSLYIVGLLALTSTALALAWYPSSTISSAFLFCSLCLISLGQGGFNPSLQAFAADQMESEDNLPCRKDEQKANKKSFFFQSWYFGVCSGSLSGITVMSYIQDTFGWIVGFAIPTIVMVASMLMFWSGSRIYIYKQDDSIYHKPFANIVQAIKETASKFRNSRINLSSEQSEVVELELQEKPLCPQNSGSSKGINENPISRSKIYTLENTKEVPRLLPMWAMLLIFAVIFQQPATFFTKQGITMKRSIGGNFKIPPATLQSAIGLSVILMMPLYDKMLIPFTRLITRDEKGISVLQRIGIGMTLCIIAMVIAAVVESWRLQISQQTRVVHPKPETVSLSIFWLLPQYILLGISDIFTVVGMQEFFYTEVPMRMKTMGIALYTSVFGVGSFVSALLISLVEIFTGWRGKKSWFSDDMGEAHLDKYHWLLALLSALRLLVYAILCKFHKSRSDLDDDNCG